MEGLRIVGDPHTMALRYAEQGADEILYLDVTASLYGRPAIHELVTRTTRDVYVPLTVGGGIRTVPDVRRLMRAGADKVAINTAAIERPVFITELAKTFGSQCVVVSVEIKAMRGSWDAYKNTGRDSGARWALDWCIEAVERGAGELLVTSVDRDGTQQGLDLKFMAKLSAKVQIPVVLAGGFGAPDDAARAVTAGADAVAIGAWLHAGGRIQDVKDALAQAGREVRR
jgi:cyclase